MAITSDAISMNYLVCWSLLLFHVSVASQLSPVISGWPRPETSAEMTAMTVKDHVQLHCTNLHEEYEKCHFTFSSQMKSFTGKKSESSCTLEVSGSVLRMPNSTYKSLTQISCGYTLNGTQVSSENITVKVFNFDLPLKYSIIAVVIFGLTILFIFCISGWGCYVLISNTTKKTRSTDQGYLTQQTDMDQQGNYNAKEIHEGQTNEEEDSLCYATVLHPCDVRSSPRVVRFEPCSDYASVIIS
ncbi:uncharacterized protein LOC134458805 [Engraulis encrasicolus]|uniref:uncharacterized protein LOC134458805 n=1 Tax=Engraulis encrasicolus TaxID=184585 RepID=UPI002FCF83C3